MIALFDFRPNHCPSCGLNLRLDRDNSDYFQEASCICPGCQFQYQYVPTDTILETATACNGDLAG